VPPRKEVQRRWSLNPSGHWYDFTVTVDGSALERRFAGRVETGGDGISDPALVWQEDGLEWLNVYDVRQAAYECWDLKLRKTSQYFQQGDVHMEQVNKHCTAMRDSFTPIVVG